MKPRNLLIPVLAAGILSACGRKEAAPPPAPTPAAAIATNPPALATTAAPGFEKLRGKWLRPDGGYILDIQVAAPDGKMAAFYFNPRPIHVARAEASRERGALKVFIELRDVNYPGSTYTLSYDPETDRLAGNYFQAAMGQNFDVEFVRTP